MDDYQKQVKELDDYISSKTGKKQNAYAITTNLSAEIGELCDEVIGLEGDRVEDIGYTDKKGAAKEIVDVMYNLLRLANAYDINIDEAWNKRLGEITKKFE